VINPETVGLREAVLKTIDPVELLEISWAIALSRILGRGAQTGLSGPGLATSPNPTPPSLEPEIRFQYMILTSNIRMSIISP
jgi:hypothetical protein